MKKVIYSAALILTLSLAACSSTEEHSPQEILNQAMQETSELTSYYAEYKITMEDGTEVLSKQWAKNGKNRVEIIDSTGEESLAINDGKTLTSYTKSTNTAMIMDISSNGDGFVQLTLKEQALRLLEQVQDSHDITIGEQEKIAGHETYHLIAKEKKSGSLYGDMEIWVDKKTWMTLKSVTSTEDMAMTVEFTKFEPNAKIKDELFVADLPEDATIEMVKNEPPAQLTMEEATEKLGAFLIFPESTGYKLESIEDMNMPDTGEIALTYTKNDEPQFTLSVFKPIEQIGDEEDTIEVRKQQGTKMDSEYFKLLQWDEQGLRYNVIFENPDLTFEQVLAITEQMEFTK
ncbi:outer membrane lipoprotein carrier protein LolA [Solibacillus sp. MA9]|uniref:Outer membrane lipoprotein carrier protein LolA n=1 Tax=Solibacillus palustris TaxID=2908203 RepID=A0ABS9UFY7_9BACL|nr:outer membrane lipoprotein carrier protein LolA [Solibacillus sp. MA9]MCH7323055.1 outer membrane lipoprotein carrier protein LolA [Solibacillus sp. MA9]